MIHASHVIAGAALAAVVVTLWSPSAQADERVRVSAARSAETLAYVKRTPNENLIAGGAFLLGSSYAFSIVAAAKSDLPADDRLYIPIAGPWMDLNERPACGNSERRPDCKTEPLNKGLLVTSGIVQGIGAAEILGGFLFPKTEVIAVRAGGVTFHPTAGRSGVGVTATGAF